MDDQFLKQFRETPRPEFARQLMDKIEGEHMNVVKQNTWQRNLVRWSPAFIAVAIVLAAGLILTVPPARALAQDFLNLFRVKKFATISVDPTRIKQLGNLSIDTDKLFADTVQVVKDPGTPVTVGSVAEAGQRAGFNVAVPSDLPQGAKLAVSVQGEGSAVITGNVAKAQEVLNLVGINDVTIPAQLDGAKITITKPAAVNLDYTFKNGEINFMQSPSPEVDLPAGVQLKQLGEIGLRVLGLSKEDAANFAANIDWNTTFLIPIPADAAEVRQVTVNGADGLMMTSTGSGLGGNAPSKNAQSKAKKKTNGNGPRGISPYAQGDSIVLWANNGMVYAMLGNGSAVDLLAIANSVK